VKPSLTMKSVDRFHYGASRALVNFCRIAIASLRLRIEQHCCD